jgi:flagellar hook-length control protein FliK
MRIFAEFVVANIAAIAPAPASAQLAPPPALPVQDDDFDSMLASYTPQHQPEHDPAPRPEIAAAPIAVSKIVPEKTPNDIKRVARAPAVSAAPAPGKSSPEAATAQKSEPESKPATPASNGVVTQQISMPAPQAAAMAIGTAQAGQIPDAVDAAPVADAPSQPLQEAARATIPIAQEAPPPLPDPAGNAQPQKNAPAQAAAANGTALPAHVVDEIVAAAKGQAERIATPAPGPASANIAAMFAAARAAIKVVTTVKSDVQSESRPAAKSDAGSGATPSARVGVKTEVDVATEAKFDAAIDPKLAAAPDAKTSVKPDSKPAMAQIPDAGSPDKNASASTDPAPAQRDAAGKIVDDRPANDQPQKPQAAAPEKMVQPGIVREPVVQAQTQAAASIAPSAAAVAPAPTGTATPVPANATAQAPSPLPNADVQPNIGALAAAIAAKSAAGSKTFEIRLDPPEMGRVDVHLTVDNDGKAHALLTADRPQTLELLQRDSQNLERALKDAGLNLSNNSLNFSLKGEGRQGDGGGASMARTRSLTSAVVARAEAANASEINFGSATGRLDIRV